VVEVIDIIATDPDEVIDGEAEILVFTERSGI
jgi:hypothetical protein